MRQPPKEENKFSIKYIIPRGRSTLGILFVIPFKISLFSLTYAKQLCVIFCCKFIQNQILISYIETAFISYKCMILHSGYIWVD